MMVKIPIIAYPEGYEEMSLDVSTGIDTYMYAIPQAITSIKPIIGDDYTEKKNMCKIIVAGEKAICRHSADKFASMINNLKNGVSVD